MSIPDGYLLDPQVDDSFDSPECLPLSYAQQRLWFLAQMEGASEAYHIPLGVRLEGELDREALRRALDRIVYRHEVLRTTFGCVDGEAVQQIGSEKDAEFWLLEHDLRSWAEEERQRELARLVEEEAGEGFDLQRGPVIRGRLIRLAEDEHVLLITMHHIVSDGWSMGVLVRELNALYKAFLGGEDDPLPELEIQYADYAVWQRKWMEGDGVRQQGEYWRSTLTGAPALLELPTDHTRPVQQSYAGAALPVVLEEKLTVGLKDLSRRHGTTLYMTLLAGWAILLARLSGQQDVVIGSPVANRGRTEIENLIGFFVNTLALRLDLSGSPSVSELLQQAKVQSLAAQQHQDIPFEQVVELAQPVRSLAHSPLFQVMFAWNNATEGSLELPGLELQPFEPSPQRVAKFDMTLSLHAAGDSIAGVVEYASALFEAASVRRYIGYFLALLKAMVADDALTIDRLPMVSEEERDQVLYEWNETGIAFPADKCVHELFEEQVHRTPNATAVRSGEDSLCYIELDEQANQLAHYLKQMGVGPEVLVGICLNRSLDMLVALLGILKSGGVYVPLDPSYPVERLGFILEDAQIPILLTQASLRGSLPTAMVQIVSMDEDWKDIAANSIARVEGSVHGSNLAYVIYTSGSTGQPKGVGVTHKGMVNYVNWARQAYKMSQGSGSPVYSSLAFDLTITSIYPALLGGGCVDVLPQSAGMEELAQRLESSDYSLLKLTPSHLRMLSLLLEKSERGERGAWTLIIGGEALRYADLELWRKPGSRTRLINEYGPTETVVGSSIYEVEDERESGDVPVGKPIANTQVYVVDEEMEPVPVGVSGELYIGGAGLARGYLNRPELTAERFVPDPFASENTVGGRRLYRTGDLVRWQADGNLEYLGRLDHQVKIRGFRIELEEIEAVLERHSSVARCVVLAREDQPGEKRLVAYVVKTGVPWTNASSLEEYLKVSLPEYMVPTVFVELEKLPLNHNGKIDRKNLPQPNTDTPEEEYVGPRDLTEETLCRLWQEVLRRERVGIHDNFFNIGGHSLLAVQVILRIKLAFATEIPVSALFTAPTVARMAKHIAEANRHERPQSSPILVSIQPHGSRAPFFCVHPVGGQVISYAELSQELGLEQPFYGLQSPPAEFFPESDVSIEQMATLYNQQIRSVQPVGPYLLSGWSMGGLVAWEMAQQLIKEGETISLLALIDTVPPPKYREADDRGDEISMLARFAFDMSRLVGKDPRPLMEQFLQADAQDQWKMVQETLISYGVLAPQTAYTEMTTLLKVFTRNALAMNNYPLNPSNQPVVYFRASETPERFSKLWTKWSRGGIQLHSVPGDHFTMLRRPNVHIIDETLQRYFNQQEERVAGGESGINSRELTDIESQRIVQIKMAEHGG